MTTVALKEAKTKLEQLLSEVAKGEEVLITREDGSAFKLIAASRKKTGKNRGGLGSARGQIVIKEGFKEIPEGFEDYLPPQ